MVECKICGEFVKGKKKGSCRKCRDKYPYQQSSKGDQPFDRLKLSQKEGKSK